MTGAPQTLSELLRSLDAAGDETASAPTARPEFEYVPEGWERARGDPAVRGWDVESIVEAYRRKWPSFEQALAGAGPLGIAHEVPEGEEVRNDDERAHNLVVSFGWALALAARESEHPSLLDWGGGIGHYYALARELLPGVPIAYHCKDVPALAEAGRELFPDATFHEDDRCLEQTYDLVLASGSLQYAEDWRATLAGLARATGRLLLVTRLPVTSEAASFTVLQRAYAYGYATEYVGWVIGRIELLDHARASGLELVRELLTGERFTVLGAPEELVEHRGFLFHPR